MSRHARLATQDPPWAKAAVLALVLVFLALILLLPLVSWVRVTAKGHTFWQTVVGAGLSFAITLGTLLAFGFIPFRGI